MEGISRCSLLWEKGVALRCYLDKWEREYRINIWIKAKGALCPFCFILRTLLPFNSDFSQLSAVAQRRNVMQRNVFLYFCDYVNPFAVVAFLFKGDFKLLRHMFEAKRRIDRFAGPKRIDSVVNVVTELYFPV